MMLPIFAAVLAASALAAPPVPAPVGPVIAVGYRKQLFVDDALIAFREGLRFTVHPPRKTGERVIVPDRPWEGHRVGAYNTVLEDDGVLKLWYDAIANDGSRWLCYATSRDGVTWEKPELGIVPFAGGTATNIVFPPRRTFFEPGSVFIDRRPGVPPSERFKMVARYGGEGGRGTYAFVSPDGLRWRPVSGKPSFGTSDTGNTCFWDERIGRYVAYVRMWTPMRTVGRCAFDDLADWGEARVVLSYDDRDPPRSDLYTNAAIRYPFADRVYLLFPSLYFHYPEPPAGAHANDGPLEIHLAVSRNGILWHRPSRAPFVARGVDGAFDACALYMTTGIVRRGAELWMYYTGYDFTHGAYDVARDRNKGAISRLVLRLDGFMSLEGGAGGGSFTTVPIVFSGDTLVLNADVSVGGAIRVEILDRQGWPIEGFAPSEPVEDNGVAQIVRFRGGDLGDLAGRPVRLRFLMRRAHLYAFQFREAEAP